MMEHYKCDYLLYNTPCISLTSVVRSLMISFIINISSIIWYRTWISCHFYHIISHAFQHLLEQNQVTKLNHYDNNYDLDIFSLDKCLYSNLLKCRYQILCRWLVYGVNFYRYAQNIFSFAWKYHTIIRVPGGSIS